MSKYGCCYSEIIIIIIIIIINIVGNEAPMFCMTMYQDRNNETKG
jgi:uncharacterized protein YpmB